MITDEERREIAQKLRELPIDMYSTIDEWEKDGLFINNSVSDEGDYSQIHDAVFGYFPAEYMHPGDYEELHERLADLIDRPMCHDLVEHKQDPFIPCKQMADGYFHCSSCDWSGQLWEYIGFGGMLAYEPVHCPKCGEEIKR